MNRSVSFLHFVVSFIEVGAVSPEMFPDVP